MWGEFLVISEHLGTRDFSRERCSESDMHLLARLSAWLTELEPGLSQQFSDITTQLVAPDWQRPLSSWKVSEGSGSGPRRDHRPLFFEPNGTTGGRNGLVPSFAPSATIAARASPPISS